jgi:hypothetical protein
MPGLYRLVLPGADGPSSRPAAQDVPFVVMGEPAESNLIVLGEDDFAALRARGDIQHAETLDQLIAAITGQTPGMEIWPLLALAALLAAVGEIALTRWVAVQRKLHLPHAVSFGDDQISAERMQQHLAGEAALEQDKAPRTQVVS